MIVVAIIGLLVGLAFIFFRPGEDALALDRAAQKVAQDVRSVAQLALKAESHSCSAGVGGGKTSAYGIIFDKSVKTSYELFADCDREDPAATSWDPWAGYPTLPPREADSALP